MTKVTLIQGDGIGPEIVEQTIRILTAVGIQAEWELAEAGLGAFERSGTPLPQATVDSIARTGIVLKGPLTTPVGGGIRSVTVALRKQFDMFACVRPVRSLAGVPRAFPNVDLVVIRENLEDLYAGIEFVPGSPALMELASLVARHQMGVVAADAAVSLKVITGSESRRIARFAFDYARTHGRRKVTVLHKGNNLKVTDGLFLESARTVASSYPEIVVDDYIIDNACMQLVRNPEIFDVILAPNLYGDIVSDLTAGLIGGLGLAASANIGPRVAMFEPTHGSAPRHAGKNVANPAACIFAGCMLLDHLGQRQEAARVSAALAEVIAAGEDVTFDLKPRRDDPSAMGTREMADAIIARLAAQ
jgi:isocitrate dehydrogenase (NAD+)